MSILDDLCAGKYSGLPECVANGHDFEKLPEDWDGYDPITLKCKRGCGAEVTVGSDDGDEEVGDE